MLSSFQADSLFFDASSQYLHISLWNNNTLITKYTKYNYRQHSENAIETLSKLCLQFQQQISLIENLFLTTGPGYYVGVQINLLVAQIWSIYQPNIKLWMIDARELYTNLLNSYHAVFILSPENQNVLTLDEYNSRQIESKVTLLDNTFPVFTNEKNAEAMASNAFLKKALFTKISLLKLLEYGPT